MDETERAATLAVWRRGNLLARVAFDRDEAQLSSPVPETDALTIEVEEPEASRAYRILIGDFPFTPTHIGRRSVEWSEDVYLDSARGLTPLAVQSRDEETGTWRTRARIILHVLPSKATEQGYQSMLADLAKLASGLVYDLASKSRAGLALFGHGASGPRAALSANLELRALEIAWASLSTTLYRILRAPERRLLGRRQLRNWNGAELLHPADLQALLARGIDPRRATTAQSLQLLTLVESDETPEHAFIATILHLARGRAVELAGRAQAEIRAIQADRRFRDQPQDGDVSLYRQIDAPRLAVLADATARAMSLERQIAHVQARLPPARPKELWALAQATPVFLNVPAYNRFRRTALEWLRRSWVAIEIGSQERAKPTWRMYEQWIFVCLADLARQSGMQCVGQHDFAAVLTTGRFSVDLQRGASLLFVDRTGRRLRLTYEPWILPLEIARARESTVYQGVSRTTAWSPDVLIEAFPAGSEAGPDYGIVIDAKYSRRSIQYMDNLQKYLKIRAVQTGRQLVKQVWAAAPSGLGIQIDDEAVEWTYAGPTAARDEQITGQIAALPGSSELMALADWMAGTLAYLGYETAASEVSATGGR